jgi:molecular chaperone GrpE (heat shock protein)
MEENHTEKDNKNESRSEEIEVTIETQTNLEITEVGLENTEIIPEKQIEIDPNKKNIEEISKFINSIKNDVEVRNERDKYKDEAIQRMSKQIANFEKGIFEKIKKELINEIISFYDLLLNFQKKFKDLENKELQNEIDFLETEISNMLFNNSIDEIDEDIGGDINRDFHRVKKKVETTDIEKNQKILEILKKGYVWNEKILRKQDVVIAEFKEKEDINE